LPYTDKKDNVKSNRKKLHLLWNSHNSLHAEWPQTQGGIHHISRTGFWGQS